MALRYMANRGAVVKEAGEPARGDMASVSTNLTLRSSTKIKNKPILKEDRAGCQPRPVHKQSRLRS